MIGRVEGAAVAIRDQQILWAGPQERLPQGLNHLPALDCGGRAVIPGFVDAHTELLFVHDRRQDFERRLVGSSDEEIMLAGGGPAAAVATHTSETDGAIEASAFERLHTMLAAGTTTAEIRNSIAENAAGELSLLAMAASLERRQPVDIVTTLQAGIGAALRHEDGPKGYVEEFITTTLPSCASSSVYCSVGCDDGVFSPDMSRVILSEARRAGLRPRITAGQERATAAVRLAAELGAVSVDRIVGMTPMTWLH